MTKEDFEKDITRITRDHMDTMLMPVQLLLAMLGPGGYARTDLEGIMLGVEKAILTAKSELDRVGKPAPGTAS